MSVTQIAINTAFQVGVAVILSVFVWLLTWTVLAARKKQRTGYFKWVGFTWIDGATLRLTFVVMAALVLLSVFTSVLGPLRDLSSAPGTVVHQVRQMGIAPETFLAIFLLAMVKTSLSEEIVFRGVIAKRLMNWFGFHIGNLLQALIFMGVHIPLVFIADSADVNGLVVALLVARMTLSGWILGWLCHRSGGSILPCWLLHGSMNAIFYPILAFTSVLP